MSRPRRSRGSVVARVSEAIPGTSLPAFRFRLRSSSYGGQVAHAGYGSARSLQVKRRRGCAVPNCDKVTRRARFRLTRRANHLYQLARPARHEGRCARHDTRGGMRWTRDRRTANARDRGRRRRVVPIPRCWDQALRHERKATVAGSPAHRGEHAISRKPLRRGCRLSRLPCLLACAECTLFCTQDSRVRPASGIPCALGFAGGRDKMQSSDISCREDDGACPRCCLTGEADGSAVGRISAA